MNRAAAQIAIDQEGLGTGESKREGDVR